MWILARCKDGKFGGSTSTWHSMGGLTLSPMEHELLKLLMRLFCLFWFCTGAAIV
jgi:hypothetical protein